REAGRRIEYDMRHAFGGLGQPIVADVPTLDPWQRGWTKFEPRSRRLLLVGIAKHHRMPAVREVAGKVCRNGALADPSLGIGDQDDGHPFSSPRHTCSAAIVVVFNVTRGYW